VGLNSEVASSSPKDEGLDEVNGAMLLALCEEPSSPLQQILRRICIPKGTISRRLVDSLHFTVRCLGWVPDKPSDSEKARQVELSIQLRALLLSIRHQG
jgi:hypothetical protein